MPTHKKRPTDQQQGQLFYPKAVFDAGYNAYENGNDECDAGAGAEPMFVDPNYIALWRSGWRRAHEDSALPRRDLQGK